MGPRGFEPAGWSSNVHRTSLGLAALLGWGVSFHPEHDWELASAPFWRWTIDPLVIASLLLSACAYGWGTRRIWQQAGRLQGVRPWQISCFVAGWLSIVLSLLSPLDAFSDVSFAAHMTQHELLMLVAAPLLILGRPLVAMLWALPRELRVGVGRLLAQRPWQRAWRFVSHPLVALMVHALAIWIWHLPSWFETALAHEPIHALQHLSFFLTAALFWWALIHGRYGRVGYGVSVLFVFATALHTSVLGALLALGQTLWYPESAERARVLGLEPIDDQQLAGLLMWIPSGIVFAVLGLALFSAWLGDSERRASLRERFAANSSNQHSRALQ
jgi:putative membrane protein